jgi:hypothetical protein
MVNKNNLILDQLAYNIDNCVNVYIYYALSIAN